MTLKERLAEVLRKEREVAPTVLVRMGDGDICHVNKRGEVTKIGEIKEGIIYTN